MTEYLHIYNAIRVKEALACKSSKYLHIPTKEIYMFAHWAQNKPYNPVRLDLTQNGLMTG